MRIPNSDDGGRLSTNMTPMIDVVFLLIIFFLVSSHLARQESRLPLDLPAAGTHLDDLEPQNVLTINVDSRARWMIAGSQVNEAKLAEILATHHAKHGQDAPVRIRTEQTITYGRVEPILRLSAEAGLWNAAFAVHQD
ncbi:ExbD/TolR family protein [Roseimaritima ulvae]|uniref:Biopolymer transport protein ExbD n=1 Tax=Roseimaritima ulvae TaxID=980254 RepID=A0A5B9QRE1_9BACT|nr:biopolymer transporter ExbD [Roseimaritima ulvae]QEG40479.1 biopolymer transport protein ExbD [Roseimaritima ulvae]